jgi:protein CpxP
MAYRSVPVVLVLMVSLGSAIALPISTGNCMTLAQADSQSPRRLLRPERKENWLQDLNLSKEQIQKIQEIRRQYQERLGQQRQAVRQAQQEFKDLMASKNATSEQIRQKFSQVQTLQQTLSDTRMESLLAIRTVLTTEQRQKMAEFMRKRGNSGRGRGIGADL